MRGHGEGSIYERKTPTGKRWVAVLSTPRGRWSAYARSRAEAKVKLADLKRQRETGVDRATSSLSSYLSAWVADKAHSVRDTTRRDYELQVRHLIRGLGGHRLGTLTPQDVDAYLRSLECAPQTKAKRRAVLRQALQDAVRRGLIVRNASALSHPIKVERRPPRRSRSSSSGGSWTHRKATGSTRCG